MDILYSGTVSAAIEASIYNIPSVAVSAEYIDEKVNFNLAAKHGVEIIEKSIPQLMDTNIVLNVNIPFREKVVEGVKVCKVGDAINDYYLMGENGDGERYIQTNGRRKIKFKKDTDRYFLQKGYVTVTPLHYDLTNFNTLKNVEEWLDN